MNAWTITAVLSAVVGAASALTIRGRKASFFGAAIPWLGLLAWLLYHEYFVPYQGGGASMWPVAQVFFGTLGALTGGCTATLVRFLRREAK